MTVTGRYIKENEEAAIAEALRSGVPASITIAQGILESNSGQSRLSRQANNDFGIKCHSDWYGEHITATDDAPNECFRKYPNKRQSFRDHSDFLKKYPRYAGLFKLDPTDYKGWSVGLQNAGYATSGSYANTLIDIIQDNQLYKLDSKVAVRKYLKYIEIGLVLVFLALLIYLAVKYYKNKKRA